MKKNNHLKNVFIAGFALTLAISSALIFFTISLENDPGQSAVERSRSFARELRAYDLYDWPKRALDGENPPRIERQLARLQRRAGGVEEQLSVLKRRRALAIIDRQYLNSYQKASQKAADTFSSSAPLAAVAADAITLGGGSLSADDRLLLGKYALRITQSRFDSLALSVNVLAGNLHTPSQAAAVPALERLLSGDYSGLPRSIQRDLQIDEFLLRAAKGDVPGAALKLNVLLGEARADENIQRMGAEFFYDHNNPLRAGELFFGIHDMERAADALVLTGEISGARNIWLALASGENYKSFYNLAASSSTPEEESVWLERLLAPGFRIGGDNNRTFSIIRYTRLRDAEQAIAILQELGAAPLLDLELLRRRLEILPPTRAAAEVWMLINRNTEADAIYEWAAWYFDHQKLYGETERLLKAAERRGISAPWTSLHRGLALLRDGRIGDGEIILREVSQGDRPLRDWRFPANLGRVQETRRAISQALEYYEEAARIAADQHFADKPSRAQLQMRISRCMEALGRPREAFRAIEMAGELDGDNLMIRRELRRFEGR